MNIKKINLFIVAFCMFIGGLVEVNGKDTGILTDVNHSEKAIMVPMASTKVKVKGVALNTGEVTLSYGQTYKFITRVSPSNATNKNITWSSSNKNLVSVDKNGLVRVNQDKNGTVTITAKTKDGGYKVSARVRVKKSVKVDSVNISFVDNNLEYLYFNQKYILKANISPSNASNKNVIWSTENEDVLTIDSNGVIKTKNKMGYAVVTAKTVDGQKTSSIVLTVCASEGAVCFDNTYSPYKSNIKLKRSGAVMQSFAIHGGNLYISQQQSETYAGGTFTKIEENKISEISDNPQVFNNNIALLNNYGHAANIDIETTDGVDYLWTSCSHHINKDTYEKNKYHCRVPLNNIDFVENLNKKKGSYPVSDPVVSLRAIGGAMTAVDSVNRKLVVMYGTVNVHKYVIYNLDEYINHVINNQIYINSDSYTKQKKIDKIKEKMLFEFQFDKTTSSTKGGLSRQGFDIDGNYLYELEGNNSKEKDKAQGIFISVYKLDFENKSANIIIDRLEIPKPSDSDYWEPEGIKVYDGKLYVGISKIKTITNGDDEKTQYIFTMDSLVKNNLVQEQKNSNNSSILSKIINKVIDFIKNIFN